MSPDLIAFLKAWYDWATSGAPEGEPFRRCQGLCGASRRFLSAHREITASFGLGLYPFGQKDFWVRYETGTQHECPKRLAWVRARLVEAGDLVA